MVSDLNIFVWKWSKIAAKKKVCFFADFAVQNILKTTLPDDERPLVKGYIANLGKSLDVFEFCVLDNFSVFKKNGFWGILGPPYRGIGATIRIGREMLCLPYAGFLTYTQL